jgi:3-phenylpropionate/cinnamic acid dioxygenase small subunit
MMTVTAQPGTAQPGTAQPGTAQPGSEPVGGLLAVPEGWEYGEVAQFLYREARLADESDYDGWEALWTDDALYWVPANEADLDPASNVSFIYDNRSRIATRLRQVRTGKRYAQSPPSSLRRVIGNIELLGGRVNGGGGTDLEAGANFLAIESRARGNELFGGRVTYRLRRDQGEIRLAYKKVVLVDLDKPIPTLAFLI